MSIPFISDEDSLNEVLYYNGSLFSKLPKDHECYIFKELCEKLDTSELDVFYSPIGRRAYDPKKIISILIYSYSRGVYSVREIEQRCQEDISFMYIANNNCPNYQVISDFRKNHIQFFHNCFKQVVQFAIDAGLASLKHVSFDGSKIKANSSKYKAMSYKYLENNEKKLIEEINKLIKQKKEINNAKKDQNNTKNNCELEKEIESKKNNLDVTKNTTKIVIEKEKETCFDEKNSKLPNKIAPNEDKLDTVKSTKELFKKLKKETDPDKKIEMVSKEILLKESKLNKIQSAKVALEKREEKINPGKKIPDTKQISFADKDARIMKNNDGSYCYSYNAQICVDSDHQIIIGQYVTQNANDKNEVKPTLKNVKENTGKLPEKASTDNGYMSGENLEAFEKEGVDAYVALNKGEKSNPKKLKDSNRQLVKADFKFDKENDCFYCPGGQSLLPKKKTHSNSKLKIIYQGDIKICNKCEYKARCCKSKNNKARTISTDDKEHLRQTMREKMEKKESQKIYKQRKIIVEPVFGHIKNNDFQEFSVRGKEKVDGEFSLVCTAYNFKKIASAIMKGLVDNWVRRII